ncbi:MAG: dicarboxylate/amino acid:cation symporter [Candidatus Omnitrophica bacterium]|nr:dicarboxylate/amino acid:cation symporter [Candidatus Omnitrophota bacterium]
MLRALKNYAFPLILLAGILTGSLFGIIFKSHTAVIKPLGDIFLNLLFTAVVPLVFFSISSAIAGMEDMRRLARIMGWMMFFFILTGAISSILMIFCVQIFPPFAGNTVAFPGGVEKSALSVGDQIVKAVTTSDFTDILSKKNMLALIIFAVLVGVGTARAGEKARPFARFLVAGNEVMANVIGMIMWYAPVGLGAYFAYLVGVFGPGLVGSYGRVVALYYPVSLGYFAIAFSLYVFWAGGLRGLKAFWQNIPPTALTALATGSSVATIPVNLKSAENIGTPEDIREVVIPVGATIHMEGSCLAAIVKIAFLFAVFHMPFFGLGVWLSATGVAILAGTVISGIPAGGMLGELLIITMYGFPIEAMPLITMIGTIVDPPATMLNAVGDNVTAMMVTRQMKSVKAKA